VTLFRAAAGEHPFSKRNPDSPAPEERWPQLIEPPRPAGEWMPAPIADPIMACLAHGPADRPTPAEVAAQLELVLAGLPKPRISKLKPRLRR
jgi:hypothetical protein